MIKKLIIKKEDIVPSRPDFEVVGAFNPGVVEFGEETLLLIRVAERPIQNDPTHFLLPVYSDETKEIHIKKIDKSNKHFDFSDKRVIKNTSQNYLSSISHFRLARSKDGIHFNITKTPTLFPDNKYEEYGIEDPRITNIDGTYYITYSAISSYGINGCLITTKDFVEFKRHGILFTSDNKDIVIFPKAVDGTYYALHRPSTSEYGKLDIWIAESKDLEHWGNHQVLLSGKDGTYDNYRLGASAVPFEDKHGWIEIYHSGNRENVYTLGALLLDKKNPTKVLRRSTKPLVEPVLDYETNGFFGKVVFSCGLTHRGDDVTIYYGVSDENIACVKMSLKDIYEHLGIKE